MPSWPLPEELSVAELRQGRRLLEAGLDSLAAASNSDVADGKKKPWKKKVAVRDLGRCQIYRCCDICPRWDRRIKIRLCSARGVLCAPLSLLDANTALCSLATALDTLLKHTCLLLICVLYRLLSSMGAETLSFPNYS